MLWTRNKKREKTYLRSSQNESVQLQLLAESSHFQNIPLFGVVRQNFYIHQNSISVQLRECAAHLSLICCNCVILCVVRRGERVLRGSVMGGGGVQTTLENHESYRFPFELAIAPLLLVELDISWKILDPAPCNLRNSSSLVVHHLNPSENYELD